jgi:hypothetical protein
MWPAARAGSFPAGPPATAHQGHAGLSLPGRGAPVGASMTIAPCDVQMTTASAAAGMLAAWASARARTSGCAATVREITSSATVCNTRGHRRMWHGSYIRTGKAMAGTPQAAEFARFRYLCGHAANGTDAVGALYQHSLGAPAHLRRPRPGLCRPLWSVGWRFRSAPWRC